MGRLPSLLGRVASRHETITGIAKELLLKLMETDLPKLQLSKDNAADDLGKHFVTLTKRVEEAYRHIRSE